HARRHVGDLDVRHPLERKGGVVRGPRAEADDGHAEAAQPVVPPERAVAGAEHLRGEADPADVFGNGDVGAEGGTDAGGEAVAHGAVRELGWEGRRPVRVRGAGALIALRCWKDAGAGDGPGSDAVHVISYQPPLRPEARPVPT